MSFALGDFERAADAANADEHRLGEALANGASLAEPYADALNNVAWYSLFTGDPAAALSAAERASEMNPASAIYRLNLAHALLMNGRTDAATALYQTDGGDGWRDMIAADFAAFEAHGIAIDLIDTARRALIK